MGLWDDLEEFLATRLEQFLQANPQLQILVLLEQVRAEEERTQATLNHLRLEEKELYQQILSTAQEIQKWFERKEKAQAGGRTDLAQAAAEQEVQLLTQGNQLWSRKSEVIHQIQLQEELLQKLTPRRQELEARQQATQTPPTTRPLKDDLEARFQRWEVDQALEDLKRKMGR
ncbi:TIGR04376 family protein [Anthocerotibacter panamensis]|uniref:TIGR04376 family protein n=1 Tax=Anthocerotibacter panamensis TaxID=2857077 RepID=UPI001C405E53|nr:TIGR04376 family protein [Anthocerotibacter panamensis]